MNSPTNPSEVAEMSRDLGRFAQSARKERMRSLFDGKVLGMVDPAVLATKNDEPSPPDIMKILAGDGKGDSGTSIVAVPSSISESDMRNLLDMQLLETYIYIVSATRLLKSNPGGFDLVTPAGQGAYTRALAAARYWVMTQATGGVLNIVSSTQTAQRQVKSAGAMLAFLTALVDGFGFASSAKDGLDTVVGDVVRKLMNPPYGSLIESQVCDHLISIYYFDRIEGLDAKIPKLRLFYLHIEPISWLPSGEIADREVALNITVNDIQATIDERQMAASRATITEYVQKMSGQSSEMLRKILPMIAVESQGR